MITQEKTNLPKFVTLSQSTFPETFIDIRIKMNILIYYNIQRLLMAS